MSKNAAGDQRERERERDDDDDDDDHDDDDYRKSVDSPHRSHIKLLMWQTTRRIDYFGT